MYHIESYHIRTELREILRDDFQHFEEKMLLWKYIYRLAHVPILNNALSEETADKLENQVEVLCLSTIKQN